MDVSIFWKVIGAYNIQTPILQLGLLVLLVASVLFVLVKQHYVVLKIYLSISNLFIGIFFFGVHGTEPIQRFFAFPLYIVIGLLFMIESIANTKDSIVKFKKAQITFSFLFVIYPVVSYALGHRFPEIVTYIMPCPIITLSIAIYSGFNKKNIIIYVLLIIWGLTGLKSIMFNVYEDLILLTAGIYCLIDLAAMVRQNKNKGLYTIINSA